MPESRARIASAAAKARHIPVRSDADVLPAYRGTPIEALLINHNVRPVIKDGQGPSLVVATCMDHRVNLKMPVSFAMLIRTAGANVEPLVFNVLAAMAVRDIRTVAVIGHSDCAMLDVERHRDKFIATATSLGTMTEAEAEKLFNRGASHFGFADFHEQVLSQCDYLHKVMPEALIAPLAFDVATGELSQITAPEA